MASSSQVVCASDPCWKYDVFLSFRGVDTRKGITVDIHDRLNRSGIKTFMDEQDLQVGDGISPTLSAAIRESRFAIVVLSQNYASSAWCLEELREICLSMEDNRILPLFYHVDPTDVRYQKRSFEKDFSKHETSGRHESEKVKQWKVDLNKVAGFSGWNTNDHKTHKELVDVIVEFLRSKVLPDAIESTGDFKAFEATRQAMDEVMKALKDDEVTAIGVYGMGGVGKTTMVKHVGAHARKSGIFDYVIMAVVSQSPDLEKIQGSLAELLGFELHEKTEIGRAARLSKEIMRRKKILIILDDIWERMDLSRIGIPSYKELQKCNSKVLLTTRIRNVCHVMRCQEKIALSTLSEKDSWTLFVRNAERCFESTTFEGVAKKVAGECRGLPIALIAVARALGDKDLLEWKRAAQRLEKSQSANPDDYGEASKCIKLSYDYLRDEDYKSYFLLCCLFPEDSDIPIDDLFRYAIGKGLFRDADTLNEARERADSVATHLKHSCLLLKSYGGYVKMHDVVRDTAIQIALSEHGFLVRAGCGLKDWPRQLREGYSAVSLMHNQITKLPEKFVCPELQILLLNHNRFIGTSIPIDISETFFQTPNELRVLDLCWTNISLLPQSLCLLTNLRALHLDGCSYLDTSMIGKLKKLEILSMRHCYLKELSRKIGDLTNLKMLDFTSTSFSTILSRGIISKLHSLEELYMERFWKWGRKVEGDREETNVGFDEVTSLSNLRVLEVYLSDAACIPENVEFNPNWVKFDIYVGRRKKIEVNNRYCHKSIVLRLDTISSLPDWFCNAVMNITERLWWEGCRRLIDIFVESEHGRLHGLKLLYIIGFKGYKLMNPITWVPEKPVFENLEELHLYYVDCQELFVRELPPGSLFNLKLLKVHSCNSWGNVLLPSALLQRLPNLEELHCHYMYEIKYVFGHEALFEPEQSKLRRIELWGLHRVRSICHGPDPPAMFQTLQSLTIKLGGLLGSLFTSDVAQCLFQLKYIDLECCFYLERIVEASNKKIILPKLKELNLTKLPTLYYKSASFDIECPSLEIVNVTDCPNFSASSPDFHSRKQVQLKRGVDTRKGITADLHNQLQMRGIKTFMDEQHLQVGDVISPTLLAAIKESRFKKGNFKEVFSKHVKSGRHKTEKVKEWKAALNKVANISGWNTNDHKTHKELVDVIVEFLRSKVLPDAIESTGDFEAYEATRKAMDEVMKALKDDKVTAVGVYGMGGVGKTTLVKHVGAHARKIGIFDDVTMGVVSQSLDYRKIQGTLADLLGVKLEEETEIGRAARLSKEIMRRTKILIILDDIWERMDLSDIGIPSYKELRKCKSKVLLTTRIRNVCHAMKCQEKINLNILSKEDSWTLFVRNAGKSFESTNFDDVGRKVARECCGLPIALIAVARALGDKDLVEWKRAAQRLEKSQFANPDDYGQASKCIKLSYDYLKDEDYKSYFLLCCLFPEDYDIPLEDLFRYAFGNGLFRDADTLEDARDKADSVAAHLKHSCLLLVGERIRCVRMHDVVRDTAIQIAQSKDGFLVKAGCNLWDWPRQLHEGYSAISLMSNYICKLPEKLICPKLQILLLNNNIFIAKIPETFFQGPNELTVLDLTRTGIEVLPESFSLQTNLQALYLDSCKYLIVDTSIIGKLKKLEILSMRNCYLKELSREMGDLTNLRMLDITNGYIDLTSSQAISKLHNLEELYMQGFWDWGITKVVGDGEEVGEETHVCFDEVTSLSNLRVLKVCISDADCIPKDVEFNLNWIEFDICIGRYDSRKVTDRFDHNSISLKLDTINSLPDWFFNKVINKAERLQWEGCQRLIDSCVVYERGRLDGLKRLYITGSSSIYSNKLMNTIMWVPKEPVFQSLEEFHLTAVDCQELRVGDLLPGSLFNLKLLTVQSCYNWGNVLLPSTLLQRLPNLEELNCFYMEGIEYVFGFEALFEPKQSKLRKLYLSNLDTVRNIWDGPAPPAMFQALQSLSINWCNLQGSLFTSNVAQCLLQLEYFELYHCPFLERMVEASNKKILLPKLKELHLTDLQMLYYESATFDMECPSLEYLYVWNCPKFSASFSDFHSRKQVHLHRA
ncbi:putative disease resistance protein [Rosa sericea]